MSRRNRPGNGREDRALNAPFRELSKRAAEFPADSRRKPPRPASRPVAVRDEAADDEELFRDATDGVVPLSADARNLAEGPAPAPASISPRAREEAEALAELNDLISGDRPLELSDTDEHIEGWVQGLDPKVLGKLRAGEFAYQAHLDLHGMTAVEAKAEARQFVLRALRAGYRCLLIVHGRGRNSPDRRPVLKDGLKSWLSRGELAHVVLAFCTARQCDGGAGATYVLLRRERRKKRPFETLSGARRLTH